jgi:glycosyltransferase involved in cell wall biosynthesis
MPADVTLVVPCFNERDRLDLASFQQLLDDEALKLLFVDDGSTDDTSALLEAFLAQQSGRVELVRLPVNRGKGEAVRAGMLAAVRSNARVVGYVDADLATPPSELLRLVQIFRTRSLQVLIGSRVGLVGRAIERSSMRHYAGRVFATVASLVLRMDIYDTQCGTKLFRSSDALRAALADPFISRWAFDVELLGRLLIGSASATAVKVSEMEEEPLRVWRDVKGSKLKPIHFARAARDLAAIERDLARRRRALS